MVLTKEELDILNDVVEDAQAWADNSEAVFGLSIAKQHLEAKIAKYKSLYKTRIAKGNYSNRKQRDLDGQQEILNRWATDLATAKVKRITELKEHISRQYIAHVDSHYLKKNRKILRGDVSYDIPTHIQLYEDQLKAVSSEMKSSINALTEILAVKNYWPDMPECEGGD